MNLVSILGLTLMGALKLALPKCSGLDKMYKVMDSQTLRFREMSQEQQYFSLTFHVSNFPTEVEVATTINQLEIP